MSQKRPSSSAFRRSPTPERTRPTQPPPPETIDYSEKTEEWIDEEIERLTESCLWVEKDNQNEYKKHEVEQIIEWLKLEKFRRTLTEVPLEVRLMKKIDLIRNERMLTKGGAKVAMLATLADLKVMRICKYRDWADEDQQTINFMKGDCELLSREFENGIIRNRPTLVKEFNNEEDFAEDFAYYLRQSLLQVTNRIRMTLTELVFDLCNRTPRLGPASPNDTAIPPYTDLDFEVIRGLESKIYWLKNQNPISKEWAVEAMVDTLKGLRSTASTHPKWAEIYEQEIEDMRTELIRLSPLFGKGHVFIYRELVNEYDCKGNFAFLLKEAVIDTLEEFQKKLSSIIRRGL